MSYPLPGTRFHDRVGDHLGAKQNWQDSDDLAMLYRGPFTTEFYRQLHTVVHAEFRARKAWSDLGRAMTDSARFRALHVRQTVSMCWNLVRLPFARIKLDRLARVPHDSLPALTGTMSRDAGAQPSPQI